MTTQIFAYAKEYYSNGKYIGSEIIQEPDRNKTGYESRINAVAFEKMQIEKKFIKAGQPYYTILIPLTGRLKN